MEELVPATGIGEVEAKSICELEWLGKLLLTTSLPFSNEVTAGPCELEAAAASEVSRPFTSLIVTGSFGEADSPKDTFEFDSISVCSILLSLDTSLETMEGFRSRGALLSTRSKLAFTWGSAEVPLIEETDKSEFCELSISTPLKYPWTVEPIGYEYDTIAHEAKVKKNTASTPTETTIQEIGLEWEELFGVETPQVMPFIQTQLASHK